MCLSPRSSLSEKSRRDAMFIEKLEPIDLGEPIYGRTIVGCAPKGAPISQLCLSFYRHFTATRFFRQTASQALPLLLRRSWGCASLHPRLYAVATLRGLNGSFQYLL